MSFIVVIIVSLVLAKMMYFIEGYNYHSKFNGHGVLGPVVYGVSLAPMQYRVFIPWLYAIINHLVRVDSIKIYNTIKISFMTISLWSIWLLCETLFCQGYLGLFIAVLFYVMQFQFDYTEQYVEVAVWSFILISCLTGNMVLAIILIFVGGLNRETTVFLPMVWFLGTYNIVQSVILMMVFAVARAIPLLVYGKKINYLDIGTEMQEGFFKGKNHFWVNLKQLYRKKNTFPDLQIYISMLFWVLSILAIFLSPIRISAFIIPMFLVVWFFRGMFFETRIGLPLIVFIIPMLVML